ncbi:MAG: hypothetical protein Q8S32_02475 [Burkholderiaceae bacterium]|nr:hypothetical protein [Burkholderiaceae bacterium]
MPHPCPHTGRTCKDVFSYQVSATLNGETVPLVVQVTVNISPPVAR